ncbi:hypothetical protein TOT_040000748 [Theileria orientalis strain Shintoku]|uniref:Uncharacterized protein n=1 Tax=Theileria orientalis strain Shintoku TaxID=869250 RepID=J7MGY0_THEOR|nr:hypothetical protein TOT_040000748 [Theileria orientalis strain Shintoku]BAM42381.1 hypothetical protein TOT_040000748 [Theileria orientalis strain Shintoku]|eukprot:XP_009692682.1 hypothetical protein TOT_040000748 [Theileria orientalis strain Shintoku]
MALIQSNIQSFILFSTPYVNGLNSISSKNSGPYNNTTNITFVCPLSNLLKKSPDTEIKNNELLVNFKDYYVYDEGNKLIDRAVLTTSNSDLNKFLICNHFPNKDCKTVFMYLVDSNQKVTVSPETNQYNYGHESNFKEAEPISLNESSLVYDIDIISKNIINKHYDPNSNVYEVELGEELKESKEKPLDKQKDDVLLKLDLTNPNLTYELNGVKINDNLTSLNSLKLNNNNSDGSTTGDNHIDGGARRIVHSRPDVPHVRSDDADRSDSELLGAVDSDNNSVNGGSNSEQNDNRKPRIFNEPQVNTDGDTNAVNKLYKNGNDDDNDEWILTENDEQYEKFVSLDNCPLKVEVIRQSKSPDAINFPVYFNGFKLHTNHYKVIVNSSTTFSIKFNNRTYKLKVSNDPMDKITNTSVAENVGDMDSSIIIYDSSANGSTDNDFGRPEININGWVANLVTMVIRIITLVNIVSNISKFYFESLNYITFLILFYGYLSGNFNNNSTNNSATGSLLSKLAEKISSHLLIYIDNASNLVPVRMFLLLNLVYVINMVAIMGYLAAIVSSNFKPKLGKRLKKIQINILALFIYLLLLMVLVFLKFDRNNEDLYMIGHRFNSFYFSSITLFLTVLIILIIYQLYPRRRMIHSLNNTLFNFIDDSNRGRIYPNSLPINSIYKSSNESSPLNSLKTISGIKRTIGDSAASKSTSPKSADSNSFKFGSLVDFHGTLSTNDSDDRVLDGYQTVQSFTRQSDEPSGNSKRDKVTINDKYRLLYVNSLIMESTIIVIYYMLTKREDGIYLVKFTFWLLVSLYIQRLSRYYDEKKINKYLLIKSLKYMVLAALIRIHVMVQNMFLETGSGVGRGNLGVSIGQLMSIIILVHVNQCINHKSLNRLYKSVFKAK